MRPGFRLLCQSSTWKGADCMQIVACRMQGTYQFLSPDFRVILNGCIGKSSPVTESTMLCQDAGFANCCPGTIQLVGQSDRRPSFLI